MRHRCTRIALRSIRATDENAVPIVLTLLVTVLTNNLINGMALGTLSLLLIKLATGRTREVTGIVRGLGAVFLAYFYLTARLM
jgi:AGZA family xanthine/uracil permease-like MFS transporter